MIKGIERLRQSIENQRLSFADVEAICKECEDELSRLSWAEGVPTPRDADGVLVPLGTEELYTDKSEIVYVNSIRFNGITWFVGSENSYKLYWLNTLHRTEPDSWRKLEKDVRNAENRGACGYYGIGTEPCSEGCPGYKDLETPCEAIALKDAMLRAKALTERDVKGAER